MSDPGTDAISQSLSLFVDSFINHGLLLSWKQYLSRPLLLSADITDLLLIAATLFRGFCGEQDSDLGY